MLSINECNWQVTIDKIKTYRTKDLYRGYGNNFYCEATTEDNSGLNKEANSLIFNQYKSKGQARKSFIDFAKANNIKKYEFIEREVKDEK